MVEDVKSIEFLSTTSSQSSAVFYVNSVPMVVKYSLNVSAVNYLSRVGMLLLRILGDGVMISTCQ